MTAEARYLRAHGDMASCVNDACPSAKQCWRHLKPLHDYWQSIAGYKPDKTGKCEEFIPIKED